MGVPASCPHCSFETAASRSGACPQCGSPLLTADATAGAIRPGRDDPVSGAIADATPTGAPRLPMSWWVALLVLALWPVGYLGLLIGLTNLGGTAWDVTEVLRGGLFFMPLPPLVAAVIAGVLRAKARHGGTGHTQTRRLSQLVGLAVTTFAVAAFFIWLLVQALRSFT